MLLLSIVHFHFLLVSSSTFYSFTFTFSFNTPLFQRVFELFRHGELFYKCFSCPLSTFTFCWFLLQPFILSLSLSLLTHRYSKGFLSSLDMGNCFTNAPLSIVQYPIRKTSRVCQYIFPLHFPNDKKELNLEREKIVSKVAF